MKLAEIIIENEVFFARHNMPCAVCGTKPAVLDMNTGVFKPCWKCQERGWSLTLRTQWWRKFFSRAKEGA